MGRINRKAKVPLSLFYLKYFAYIFVFMCLLAISLLILFNVLMNDRIVYPADYAQEQAQSAYNEIQTAEQVTEDIIPELCDYAIFDSDGNVKSGNLTGNAAQTAWDAVQEEKAKIGKYSYTIIPRNTEYCVLRYTLSPQYKSSFLQKILVPPQMLIFISAILGMLFIIIMIAIRFGKALNKRLSTFTFVTSKVEHQELDFEISASGIKEVDAILHSMDNMRRALKDSLERQWQIEQEKNRQMSALAHDLKTPLTLVRGNAELLLESDLSETQKKYTEYIESSSLQMQNYVQTLIEVTKSWQGYQFRPQKIACEILFQEIEQQLRGLCTVHNLTPVWDCRYITSEISVDHDLLIRAVVNIVSNAAERTPPGGQVALSVSEENRVFMVTITDTGSGFSPEALKHGTEQFYMDDTSRTSKTHFGIGLYAADSIIKKHGGQLILDNSKETGGAKVTIKIPS